MLWLNAEIRELMAKPDLKTKLMDSGVEPPRPGNPAAIGEMISKELETWGKVIRTAGIKAE